MRARWGLLVLLLLGGEMSAQGTLTPRTATMSWMRWWELNREEFVAFRHVARAKDTDPLGTHRDDVLKLLRRIALEGDKATRRAVGIVEASYGDQPLLRSTAAVALGRMGEAEDADRLLWLLDHEVQERCVIRWGAMLGLGMLPDFESPRHRERTRKKLAYWLKTRRGVFKHKNTFGFVTVQKVLPSLTHLLSTVAAGMQARHDPLLVPSLVEAARKPAKDTHQFATALVFSCGIAGDRMLLPELTRAVRHGEFGRREKLNDAGRAHAAYALGRVTAAASARVLMEVLHGKKVGGETRRGAALGLARLLRGGQLEASLVSEVEDAFVAALAERDRPIVAGFSAIGLGGADRPTRIDELMAAMGKKRDAALRPYAALALGLAARRVSSQQRNRIIDFLLRALERTRNHELEGALCLALGLATAPEANEPLLERVRNRSRAAFIRRSAIQGLGMIGRPTREVEKALEKVLDRQDKRFVADAAVALGQLGRDDIADVIIRRLARMRGRAARAQLLLALGRLGRPEAVEPLMKLARHRGVRPLDREAALIALGFLGDRRGKDPVYSALSDFNFHPSSMMQDLMVWLGGYVLKERGEVEKSRDRR
ncbi:MAG: HEAT repeat domain-containing protein [Planctomycetota bacterium]|jgi:HEAT repeat protein